MVGDTLNLVDMIREHLTGDFGNKIASLIGEGSDKAQQGMNAAVPGILSGMDRVASTSEGSRRLANAVDATDENVLSNVGGTFGRAISADSGTSTLRSLLGAGGFSDLAGNIGRASGLSSRGAITMLGVIAPIALGVLKSIKRMKGLDALGLSNLLSSQRNSYATAIPTDDYAGAYRTSASEHPRATETYTHRGTPEPPSRSWVLPLAIFFGLLGLLWYWGSRPTVHAEREAAGVTERATVPYNRVTPVPLVSLDTLKSKYQTVIDKARDQGVEITNLSQQDGKLFIKGIAPSLEAANNVWDEIKRVNPSMDDIVADFQVKSSMVSEPAPIAEPSANVEEPEASREKPTPDITHPAAVAGEDTSSSGMESTYVVKAGDTLSKISQHFYGNTGGFRKIFDANKEVLTNPNMISVGQELKIPKD